MGAFFKLTSAVSNEGIEELFKELGRRYIDPHYRRLKAKEDEEWNEVNRTDSVKLHEKKVETTKQKKWYMC